MVISTRSKRKVYHRITCPYEKRIDTKYRKFISELEAKNSGYKECSWCGGLHGMFLILRKDPNHYFRLKKPMEFYWDNTAKGLCIQTDVGFWKILKSWNTQKYALYHLNRTVFNEKKTVPERMDGRHHRQRDVEQSYGIQGFLYYIAEHDKAKRIMQEKDYRSLPNKTKRQKKYYRQAKNKARKEQNQRIDKLFEQIQNGNEGG